METLGSVIEAIAGVLFLVLGAIFFAWYIHSNIKGKQALSWPTTKGLITSSKIETASSEIGAMPDVIYSYTVEGIKYTGRNISFTKGHTKPKKVIMQYPEGSEVNVYYNPSKPEDSVLEVESKFLQRNLFVAAFIIPICAGIYLLLK